MTKRETKNKSLVGGAGDCYKSIIFLNEHVTLLSVKNIALSHEKKHNKIKLFDYQYYIN